MQKMSTGSQPLESSTTQRSPVQRCADQKPQVIIGIGPTETKDVNTKEGLSNRKLLDALDDALDAVKSYPAPPTQDSLTENCGGRIFRTLVYKAVSDEKENDGGKKCLSKTGIRGQESKIVEALREWINGICTERNLQEKLKWSVWISRHLYADLNLAVEESTIVYDSIQLFFVGESLPTFVLVLYDLCKSSESTGAVRGEAESPEPQRTVEVKAEESAQTFALHLAKELTVELHKFCCVDFLLLPCAMTYRTFIEDLLCNEHTTVGAEFKLQIERQQRKAQWYYSGPLQLSESGYSEVKEASTLVAGVSYVPYITSTEEEKSKKKKVWLLKMDSKWRCLLSLLTEVLGSDEDVTYTLTCSEDKYRTVEITLLEAARRWAFSHDVFLDVPVHSDLNAEETKKHLRCLTGKRKHTCNRMTIETVPNESDQELRVRRCRGEREVAYLEEL